MTISDRRIMTEDVQPKTMVEPPMNFICKKCNENEHNECEGIKRDKTWCDCQHRGKL